MKVEIKALTKSYQETSVFKNFNLELETGKANFLMGPSGSGKTSLLRLIAGFEALEEGEIFIDGNLVTSKNYHKAPGERNLGYVFQDYALFPHMSVEENILFGLSKFSKKDQKTQLNKYLKLVGVEEHKNKLPHQLSGGQQQRVALARALAPQPSLLLFDEVFSNLDEKLKQKLSREVKDILTHLNLTSIFVSHLQNEALDLADELVILKDGTLMQQGKPYELYHKPNNLFVANFLGDGRFIEAEIMPTRCLSIAGIEICSNKNHPHQPGEKTKILLRPDDVIHDDESTITAKVIHKTFRGPVLEYELELKSGEKILSHVPSHHNHKIGEDIGIRFELEHIVSF